MTLLSYDNVSLLGHICESHGKPRLARLMR